MGEPRTQVSQWNTADAIAVAVGGGLGPPEGPVRRMAGMAAYVIAYVDVQDPGRMDEYRRLVGPTVERYGGRYLVAGADAETLEGDWRLPSMAVIEFESVERAKAWWESEDYREARALRQQAGPTGLVVVRGL